MIRFENVLCKSPVRKVPWTTQEINRLEMFMRTFQCNELTTLQCLTVIIHYLFFMFVCKGYFFQNPTRAIEDCQEQWNQLQATTVESISSKKTPKRKKLQ